MARFSLRSTGRLVFMPGMAVLLTTLAFNFIGDGIRDAVDPRQPAQHDRVPIPGMHQGRTGLCEPRLDDIEGALPGERPREDARVRAPAQERKKDAPAERDRLGPAPPALQP